MIRFARHNAAASGAVRIASLLLLAAALLSPPLLAAEQSGKPRPCRLPAVDLKEPILWRTAAKGDDGTELQFGGLVQNADDPAGRTLYLVDGKPKISSADLRKRDAVADARRAIEQVLLEHRAVLARARSMYFDDSASPLALSLLAGAVQQAAARLREPDPALDLRLEMRNAAAVETWRTARADVIRQLDPLPAALSKQGITADTLASLYEVQHTLERIIQYLESEPAPRAMAAMVYQPATKQFILFGGDHLDYLTNDTWVYDPKFDAWDRVRTESAPPPRAGHKLSANEDGTITLTGGYTYASNTDYMGGQYIDLDDGAWTLDLKKQVWMPAKSQKGAPDHARTYRTGPFLPAFFFQGAKPDAKKVDQWLKELPPNTWTRANPTARPQMNRDWGTAVLDPDRDVILRWSGGHCAHGGTDVPQYHISTNRWELSAPVEFPLGLLYSNTSYPEGFSFNRRAWMTGHTYQSYAYDTLSKKMYFVGQHHHTYIYDPDISDWLPTRFEKPRGMNYGSSFFTLTCCATPRGIYCWTKDGKLFLLDSKAARWDEVKLAGERLAESIVDNSTVLYDSARDRLVFFQKRYGDNVKYDGTMQAIDLKTAQVATVRPANAAAAAAVSYLCQIRYDSANDLYLAGCTLDPDPAGFRRTPAYDPKSEKWISLAIGGDDPSGKSGRNVSLGLMYDARRKLFWAVDTRSEVFVLRLAADKAGARDLE